MFIFGNQDYHIQLRLASIYIILYYSDYFRRVMINTEGEYNYKDELIPHIDNLITEISRPGSWGCNIVMIALSIVCNRPLCYINAYDQNANNITTVTGIECTHFEKLNEPHFRIAHAFNFQLNFESINFILYKNHFVPLISTSSNKSVFDFKTISFYNSYSDFIMQDEFFN